MNRTTTKVVQQLRRTALLRDGAGLTDGQLLDCFLTQQDDAAFAALVRRHGPLVWGVCRRVLHNHHDAEDAFQATFLVLVRKARSVEPKEMVANWLHGVAYRTALKARSVAARTRERERQVMRMPEPAVEEQDVWRDLQPLLDQELGRLPVKYRVPIVLCDLEGKTRKEAARQLGWREGTVAGRLATARRMLAKRLTRRGVALSGGMLAAVLAHNAASAGVPASVVCSAIQTATLCAAGHAAATGAISARVGALAEGVVKAMSMTKLKIALAVAVLAITVSGSAGVLAHRASAAGQANPAGPPLPREERTPVNPAAARQAPEPAEDAAAKELKALEGEWAEVARRESGYEVAADVLNRQGHWTFRGASLHFGGEKPDCAVHIDPGKSPKRIDLVVLQGPQDTVGKTRHGIYELEEDRLIVCTRCIGAEGRPTEFTAEKGSHDETVTLKRVRRGTFSPKEVRQENDGQKPRPDPRSSGVQAAADARLAPEFVARLGRLPAELVKARRSDADAVDALYLALLVRLPSERERETAAAHLRAAKDREEAVRDVAWALMNTKEFLKLHALDNDVAHALKVLNTVPAPAKGERPKPMPEAR